MALLNYAWLLLQEEAPAAAPSDTWVKIIAGSLAVILIVIIVLRRMKKKKTEDEF